MKKSIVIGILTALLALPALSQNKIGGKEVFRNGVGYRTMPILGQMYSASLFVTAELKGKSESEILNADQPMSVYMVISSGMISQEKFVKAVSEGFDKAAGSGYGTAHKQAYMNLFAGKSFSKGDQINNYYVPGKGLTVTLNNVALGTIGDLSLKKSFFAIFIGPKPVQASMKKGMLGQ